MEVIIPKPNPLLIDLIIENVFGFCGYNELDSCRKVCTMWEKVTESVWKRRVPIIHIVQNKNKTNSMDRAGMSRVNKNTDLWAFSRFHRFGLKNFSFRNNWNIHYQLWRTHGHVITHLELDDCCFQSGNAFRGLFFCHGMPLIQTLKFVYTRFSFIRRNKFLSDSTVTNSIPTLQTLEIVYDDNFTYLPINWSLVFQAFSGLQTLVLRNYDKGELARVFQGAIDFRNINGYCHSLKYLDVSRRSNYFWWMGFPNGILTHVIEEGINAVCNVVKLQTLVFSVNGALEEGKCHELVRHFRHGLQTLKIKCNGNVSYQRQQPHTLIVTKFNNIFPLMLALSRLDLVDCLIISFNFLYACPNLQHLNILLQDGEDCQKKKLNAIQETSSRYNMKQLLLPSILSFHCNLQMPWTLGDMLRLSEWIPRTTSLLIQASSSSFPGICQGFKHLQRLFIDASDVDDFAFTGIHNELATLDQLRPNVTDLQGLEVLGIRRLRKRFGQLREMSPHKLTEVAATHGILKMQRLHTFYVSPFSVTEKGMEALKLGGFSGVVKKTYYDSWDFFSEATSLF